VIESVALAAAAIDGGGRSWVQVMPAATEARNGPYFFTVTRDDLETYAESLRASAGRVPVDYDHSHSKGRGSRAAGWFTGAADVRDTPAGPCLYAEVQWAGQAVAEIRAGEYRFLSPEFTFRDRDAKTGLMTRAKAIVAAALTNRPHFTLDPVTATRREQLMDDVDTVLAVAITERRITRATAEALRQTLNVDGIKAIVAASKPGTVELEATARVDAPEGFEYGHGVATGTDRLLPADAGELRLVAEADRILSARGNSGTAEQYLDALNEAQAVLAETRDEALIAVQAVLRERDPMASLADAAAARDRFTRGATSVDPLELIMHVRAEQLLASRGLSAGQYTGDEYLAALAAAEVAA
jgi:hypothetical protein